MSTQPTSFKTDQVARTIGDNLTTINSSQTVTKTSATAAVGKTRLEGRQYDDIYKTSSSSSATVPGEKAPASSGSNDSASGIIKLVASAISIVYPPAAPIAMAATKALDKKA